jgi:hypothetical protein
LALFKIFSACSPSVDVSGLVVRSEVSAVCGVTVSTGAAIQPCTSTTTFALPLSLKTPCGC